MHDDYTELKIERIGHVAVLRLANPPVNALSTTLMNELTLALDRISESDDVRAVVLTGEGKVFCAGADLKSRGETIKGPGDLPSIPAARGNASTPYGNAPSRSSARSTAPRSARGWPSSPPATSWSPPGPRWSVCLKSTWACWAAGATACGCSAIPACAA